MGGVKFAAVDWGDSKVADFASYWHGLYQDTTLPFQSDFDPAKVMHLLPGIAIYELHDSGKIMCRLMGTALAEVFGWDYTDQNFLNIWAADQREAVLRIFRQIVQQPCALLTDIYGITSTGLEIDGRSVNFPVRDADGQATRLICYTYATQQHTTRDPRHDRVVELRTRNMCIVDLN